MSYKISADADPGESIRRIVCEEIDAAIRASRSRRDATGSPVHRTRKHLEKARAGLRLLISEVGYHAFKREDRRLRNVGRLISSIRDAEVRLETVKQLRHEPNAPRSQKLKDTEELLAFELDSFLAAFANWEEEATGKLKRVQAGIAHWHLHKLTRTQLRRAVRKSYARGRAAFERAREKGSAARFRELRKRSKELWYQLRLLRPLNPVVFRELSKSLRTLGEHLGHADDLSFMAERLQSIGMSSRKRDPNVLAALIESREDESLQAARALGESFYTAKPKAFAARIANCFDDRKRPPGPQPHIFRAAA